MYALADTPVGLAAFFLDHDQRSYRLISRVFAGQAADHAYLPKDPDTIATLSQKQSGVIKL